MDPGRLLVYALGVAASPVTVVALLVILLTKRGRVGSIVFAVAWVAGVIAALTIGTIFAGKIGVPSQGIDLPSEGLASALLGAGLICAAVLVNMNRRRAPESESTPGWLVKVDDLSPAGGALLGFANATTSPKNLALALGAGVLIRTGAQGGSEVGVACLLYVLVASLSVLVPLTIYFAGGQRSETTIARWKQLVTAKATAITELVVFAVGIGLAAKGLANLLGAGL